MKRLLLLVPLLLFVMLLFVVQTAQATSIHRTEAKGTVMVFVPNQATEQVITSWFKTNPQLLKVAQAHNWVVIESSESRFKEFYHAADKAHRDFCVGAGRPTVKLSIPAVMLLRKDGCVVTNKIDGVLHDAVFFGPTLQQSMMSSLMPDMVLALSDDKAEYVDYKHTGGDTKLETSMSMDNIFRRRHHPCPDTPVNDPGTQPPADDEAPVTAIGNPPPAPAPEPTKTDENTTLPLILGGGIILAIFAWFMGARRSVHSAVHDAFKTAPQ